MGGIAVTTLIVLMGVPGSGKTTWAKVNANGAVVCSTDRLRLDRGLTDAGVVAYLNALRTKASRSLAAGLDVVVDGCNTRRDERARWLGTARVHRVAARLVVIHTSTETASAVQRDRTHAVGVEAMRTYQQRMHRALPWLHREGWDEVVHVEPGDAPRRWVQDVAP